MPDVPDLGPRKITINTAALATQRWDTASHSVPPTAADDVVVLLPLLNLMLLLLVEAVEESDCLITIIKTLSKVILSNNVSELPLAPFTSQITSPGWTFCEGCSWFH